MTATATAIRVEQTIVIDGETYIVWPMDKGGWKATYGEDLVLAATDGKWIGGSLVNWSTDEGEDEVRWPTAEAAIARIYETCHS